LVTVAESDSTIGALQPKLLSLIDKGYFEYAGACGGFLDKYGYPFLRGRVFYTIEKDEKQYDNLSEVFWTSGAALFLRADALKRSGDLDEEFFLHMEEIDLCWRMHLVGYKLMVIPASIVYHYVGAALPQGSFMKLYLNHRNNIMMMIKNLGKKNLLPTILIRTILDIINIFYSSIVKLDFKHAWAIIQAYLWLVFHPKLIIYKRRSVQNLRTVEDDQFSNLIYPRSLILDYFVKGKKTFSSLIFRI
jgi:GT2 family glycosyltransferase